MWPDAPYLPIPAIMEQTWMNAVFLHWRIPAATSASLLPTGVVPDMFDDSAWVGLIGFRMSGAGFGTGVPVPYFGSFNEINVRLYSREPDGTRGVVFVTLDASRLAVVLAARAAGLPYVWSQCRWHERHGEAHGYSVRRYRGGGTVGRGAGRQERASTSFAVEADPTRTADDPLSVFLTARFGLHSRFRGGTIYIPNTHTPWPLRPARLTQLNDGLLEAAGITVSGPPESVLFSPGVQTQFGRPRRLVPSGESPDWLNG